MLPCDYVKTGVEFSVINAPIRLLVFYRWDTIRDDRVSVIDPSKPRFLYPDDRRWGGEPGNGV